MNSKKRHIIEFFFFIALSVVSLALFFIFRYDKDLLKLLSGAISLAYVLWGIIHSGLEGRLTKLVALEYLLFGALAFLLLFTALSFE